MRRPEAVSEDVQFWPVGTTTISARTMQLEEPRNGNRPRKSWPRKSPRKKSHGGREGKGPTLTHTTASERLSSTLPRRKHHPSRRTSSFNHDSLLGKSRVTTADSRARSSRPAQRHRRICCIWHAAALTSSPGYARVRRVGPVICNVSTAQTDLWPCIWFSMPVEAQRNTTPLTVSALRSIRQSFLPISSLRRYARLRSTSPRLLPDPCS